MKCIDYGDAKYKFDFPISHTDSLHESLWNELDVLEAEIQHLRVLPMVYRNGGKKEGRECEDTFLGL